MITAFIHAIVLVAALFYTVGLLFATFYLPYGNYLDGLPIFVDRYVVFITACWTAWVITIVATKASMRKHLEHHSRRTAYCMTFNHPLPGIITAAHALAAVLLGLAMMAMPPWLTYTPIGMSSATHLLYTIAVLAVAYCNTYARPG